MSQEMLRLDANMAHRGRAIRVTVDGQPLVAYEGETIATTLMASGKKVFRHTHTGAPRGIFCGIGLCYDCTVTIDGIRTVRACVTPVGEGMNVSTLLGSTAGSAGRD